MDRDPLEDLLVDEGEINKELLAALLAPYVRLSRDTASVILTATGRALSNKPKIIVYLLARKALRALSLIESEGASTGDVTNNTGIPGGSVRPTLRNLLRDTLVAQTDEGDYYVPVYALEAAKALVEASSA